MTKDPKDIRPDAVLKEVVDAIHPEVRPHIIVIGSLAAAHWLSGADSAFIVRTKDVDSVLSPRGTAPTNARAIAEELLSAGWQPRPSENFGEPGTSETPDDRLPALRLNPPNSDEWFLELLTEPEPGQSTRRWLRFTLSNGDHYGLPSFRFTSIAIHDPRMTRFGILAARPEMMALANLLEHPEIGPEMIKGTNIKRSNKDLGRVLAIARLSTDADIDNWADAWVRALTEVFPFDWKTLVRNAGNGLRQLLNSPADLQQAMETCNNGLLASRSVTAEQLKATGERLVVSAIADLERAIVERA